MKYRYFFSFLLITTLTSAQSARIYFYRASKFVGSAVDYKVYLDSTLIGRATPGSVLLWYSAEPGLHTIRAKTEGESSITIDVKPGGTYYIECTVTLGAVVGHPSFRQVSAAEAKSAMDKISPQPATAFGVDPEFATDTARALSNMFHRKKKGGSTRAIIFGAIGFISLIGTIKQSGTSTTIQGQTIDTGPDPASYVFLGVCTVVAITGITQASKYNQGRLTQVVSDYKAGRGIPKEFKLKLKAKDFK